MEDMDLSEPDGLSEKTAEEKNCPAGMIDSDHCRSRKLPESAFPH